ncbi:MAG: electron transfer flavoprotein subunit beta/FixA family protein [Nevskia sp.]
MIEREEKMKALVSVKRVIDYNVRIQVKPDGSGVVTDGVKHSVNPFDEIAMEEAVRLKEKGKVTEIIAVTVGGAKCEETLRTALAFGADRAVHIKEDGEIQPLTAAQALAAVFKKEGAALFLLGKQAIDDDAGQTGQMVAALLDLPQATFASKVEIDGNKATVTREVDAGLETLEIDLPGIVTTDLRLNEPRYLKLPDIMKAKKKPIETVSFADLGVSPGAGIKSVKTVNPPKRSKGVMVKTVDELVTALKGKGLI